MAFEIGTASDHADLLTKIRAFLVAGANASGTLTLTGNAGNGNTVTIGAKTYTFETVLTNVDGNVLIGATPGDSLNNLVAAIRLAAGAGTTYAAATTAHPTARAYRGAGDTMIVKAKTPGTGGNSLATTETLTNGSFGGATMAGGGTQAWTELDYDATGNTAIFEAPGLAGGEEIHVGFGYEENVAGDAYALTGWMFRAHNALLGHQSQPGHSGLGYHPVWDTSIPYWFIANGRRAIIATKVSTVYTASYLGKFLPYGTTSEYPQPYYMSMPYVNNTRWSTVTEGFRNFWDPGNHAGSRFLHVGGAWFNVGNFQNNSSEQTVDGGNYIWPFHAGQGFSNGSAVSRWRELRENLDGGRSLTPTQLCGENPNTDVYGELDGCYGVSGFSAASEDTIDIGPEEYLILQSTFHTERYHYAALHLS